MSASLRIISILIVALLSTVVIFAQVDNTTDPLVRLLQAKGVLTDAEARSITTNATPLE